MFIMRNSNKTDVIIVKRFSGAMFDDEDSFGIIRWILQSGRPVSAAGSGGIEVDLNKLAQRVEEAVARWLVESGEVVAPRSLLLQLLDEAIKAEVGNVAYLAYDKNGRELKLEEVLDLVLQKTHLHPIADGVYFLVPRDLQLLFRTIGEVARVVGLSGQEVVAKIYGAFAEGGEGDTSKWYHEKVAQAYGVR